MPETAKKELENMSIQDLSDEIVKSYVEEEDKEDKMLELLEKGVNAMEKLSGKPVLKKKLAKKEDEEDGEVDENEEEEDEEPEEDEDMEESDVVKSLEKSLQEANDEISALKEDNMAMAKYSDKISEIFQKAVSTISTRLDDMNKAIQTGVGTLLKAQLHSIKTIEKSANVITQGTPEPSRMERYVTKNAAIQGQVKQEKPPQIGVAVNPEDPDTKAKLFKSLMKGEITKQELQYIEHYKQMPPGKTIN